MPDLAYQSLAVLTGLAGLALLYWALFRDRSRGRRRCPKCWYDLRCSESLTCPECGYTAKRERQFFKTRRRWRWVASVLLLGLGSYALWLTPTAQRDGWRSLLPTPVIIVAMRYDPAASLTELKKRWRIVLYRDKPPTLDGWQYRLAIAQAKTLLGPEQPTRQRTDMLEFILLLNRAEPVGDILLAWLNEDDITVQASAISVADFAVLAPSDNRAVAQRVYELAQSDDQKISASATTALGRFVNDDPRYVELLLSRLSNSDPSLAMRSATALGNLQSPDGRVLRALCEMLRSNNHSAWIAADTLAAIGDGTVALSLAQSLRSADYSLATGCAEALLEIGSAARSAEVTSALVACLDDRDATVRGAAVAALVGQGSLGEPFLPAMISALDEKTTEAAARVMIDSKLMEVDSPILAPLITAMVDASTARIEETTGSYQTCEYLIALMMWNPAHSESFIPLLLRFVDGPSTGLQLKAVVSLRYYGPRAKAALPALENALEQASTEQLRQSLEGAIGAINERLPRF